MSLITGNELCVYNAQTSKQCHECVFAGYSKGHYAFKSTDGPRQSMIIMMFHSSFKCKLCTVVLYTKYKDTCDFCNNCSLPTRAEATATPKAKP